MPLDFKIIIRIPDSQIQAPTLAFTHLAIRLVYNAHMQYIIPLDYTTSTLESQQSNIIKAIKKQNVFLRTFPLSKQIGGYALYCSEKAAQSLAGTSNALMLTPSGKELLKIIGSAIRAKDLDKFWHSIYIARGYTQLIEEITPPAIITPQYYQKYITPILLFKVPNTRKRPRRIVEESHSVDEAQTLETEVKKAATDEAVQKIAQHFPSGIPRVKLVYKVEGSKDMAPLNNSSDAILNNFTSSAAPSLTGSLELAFNPPPLPGDDFEKYLANLIGIEEPLREEEVQM